MTRARPEKERRAAGALAPVAEVVAPLAEVPAAAVGDEAAQLLNAVEALHRELEGLRASSRLRAVIEQAKGVLVERYGISLDEAFDRLRELSQQHNVRLVEVAATLVGASLPDEYGDEIPDPVPPPVVGGTSATSAEWTALREQPEVRAKTAAAIFHGVSSSVAEGDEAARLIRTLADPLDASGVILYRLAADGSLRLVGSDGFPGDFISAWRAIPPNVDVPVARAAATATPVYVRDTAERTSRFPATASVRAVFESSASIPVIDVDTQVGVLSIVWHERQEFDHVLTSRLEHLTRTAAPVLLRSVRHSDPDLAWLRSLLGLLLEPWVLVDPVVTPEDGVVDFEIVLVSPDLPDGEQLVGRRVVELWPGLVTTGVLEDMVRVERFGGVSDERALDAGVADVGSACDGARLRVVRVGTRLVLHWRPGSS